jgi:1-aminocyclopropane-1-carboxylate deaminase/D-cysteine desulfhydrase-like pyridoxal-dependent ACC family enzyme
MAGLELCLEMRNPVNALNAITFSTHSGFIFEVYIKPVDVTPTILSGSYTSIFEVAYLIVHAYSISPYKVSYGCQTSHIYL